MRRVLITVTLTAVLAGASTATPAGSIVSSFRSPSASVYGLDYAGETLFHPDGGHRDYVYLTTRGGSVIRSYLLPPQVDAADVDNARAYLYACNFAGRVFTLNATGSLLNSWPGPGGACYGVASNGTYLFISNGNRIHRYYGNGSRISSFTGPWVSARGVDFAAGYLWVADRGGSGGGALYQVTTGGSIITSFYQTGHNPVGIAFDPPYIWYTDDRNNYVYQVTYSLTGVAPASLGRVKAIY